MSRSWYERALGGRSAPQPPNYPPSNPQQPYQQPQTWPGPSQQEQASRAQKQEAFDRVRQGQGSFMDMAALYDGGVGTRNAKMCPECGGDKFFRPTPSSIERCFNCGYNDRFHVFG